MKQTAKHVAVIGAAAAILLVCQVAMNFLPNIEVVSLLVVLYTRHFEKKTLWIIYVFVLIEGLIYGFALWWICYLYIWTILYAVVRLMRGMDLALGWAVVLGLFGLLFGALSSIPTFFILGFYGGVAYFVQGILFDLVHCVGNFVLALVLYKPLDRILERIGHQLEQ